ncbi:MAG: APC family permease [Acidobacteriota bacterium]|jgi:amino acid transporter|nr:APC family permease [Acidobacteriota bacterium]
MRQIDARSGSRVVVATTAMLSFISFWRAAAIVLNDLGSSAFYVGGIAEHAIGKSAPWFILGVMLFSIAVRSVYIESSTLFVRGGAYRVVKEAMGPTTAKITVSALIFDFLLTAPISGVSAGHYLVGLLNELLVLAGLQVALPRDTGAAFFAILFILYFWRLNLMGIEESSSKALSIMKVTSVMVVLLLVWGFITLLLRGGQMAPIPGRESMVLGDEALGWLHGSFLPTIPLVLFFIGFGHSILAMSGEETLAQVYREIAHPKLKNLKKAAIAIFIFSLVFTSLVSFLGVGLIPDSERPHYYDNLIGGIAMFLAGPFVLRLCFHVFVVIVGVIMLAGACNTAIIGSNGVLNRLSEDGVLVDWFRKPHREYGTTYRLLNMIVGLQILIVIFSRGDVFILGEAYAFGVIWSFAMNALATLILRFKRPEGREWKVPLNFHFRGIEVPVGLVLVTLILFATAIANLLTKKVATISGVFFTAGLFAVLVFSERLIAAKRLSESKDLEKFLLEDKPSITKEVIGVRPGNILVAVRNYESLYPLEKILRKANTRHQDIVVLTGRRMRGVRQDQGALTSDQIFMNYEQKLFSMAVSMAEKEGKKINMLVVPGNDITDIIIRSALQIKSSKVVAGVSNRMSMEEQARRLGEAWEAAGPHSRGLTLELIDRQMKSHFFDIGPHPPRLWPVDIGRLHDMWLRLSRQEFGSELHHRDVVGVALKRLDRDLMDPDREQEVLNDFHIELESEQHRRESSSHGISEKPPKADPST